MSQSLFPDRIPLWAVFFITIAVVMLSILAGLAAGRRQRGESAPHAPIGSVVGAVLALLAFLLAFTFGIASSRFDTRKQLLLDDVNALSTAVRRADLLPEPQRSESRNLLRNYVDLRVEAVRNPRTLARGIAATEALQDQLWSRAIAMARTDLDSDIGALYIESLNNLINVHTARKTVALLYRIPPAIWLGLYLVTVLSMWTVGYQFGQSGRHNTAVPVVLALTFSTVVVLIVALDRPTQGVIRVNQEPMLELQRKLSATGGSLGE